MEIRTNEPMARHISFRVGGPADRFMIPESETELREAVLDCKKVRTALVHDRQRKQSPRGR